MTDINWRATPPDVALFGVCRWCRASLVRRGREWSDTYGDCSCAVAAAYAGVDVRPHDPDPATVEYFDEEPPE